MSNVNIAMHLFGKAISRHSLVLFVVFNRIAAIVLPFLTAAQRAYFDEFDFLRNTISSTCQPSNNPLACFFCPFNLVLLVSLAILFVPFLHQQLAMVLPRGRWLVMALLVIGSTGYSISILVNLDISKPIHTIAALTAIACFVMGLLLGSIALNVDLQRRGLIPAREPSIMQVRVVTIAFVLIIALLIMTQGISMAARVYPSEGTILSFPLWEWITFIAFNAMIISLVMVNAARK